MKGKMKQNRTPLPAQTQFTEQGLVGEDTVTETIASAQHLTSQKEQKWDQSIRRGHLFQVSQESSVTTKLLL